jgi:hypothetical protein
MPGTNWHRVCGVAVLGWLAAITVSEAVQADGLSSSRAAQSSATERGVWYGGYDVVKGARYVYDGILVALNGDLGKDGFAIRAYGARVDFDLDPGDGRGYQADIMLGYLFNFRDLSASVFVGPDWQNIKLSPDDPTAEVRGTEFGVRVSADLATADKLPYYLNLSGSYSSAFNTYWSRLRLGLNRQALTFGPEFIAMGNDSFDAQRVGGFAKFKLPLIPQRSFEVTVSAGHQFVSGSGNGTEGTGGSEGTYGAIGFSTTF